MVCIWSEYVYIFLIGRDDVYLCSQKFVNRKEQIHDVLMYLLKTTSLWSRDADRVLNGFRVLVPDLPRSTRSVLRTGTSVQLKFISGGAYYHLGLKTNLLRYVELWLCTFDFDTLNFYVNVDGLPMSASSSQQLWPMLERIAAPRFNGLFMIGIYGGNSEPAEFNEFSADTISEINDWRGSV